MPTAACPPRPGRSPRTATPGDRRRGSSCAPSARMRSRPLLDRKLIRLDPIADERGDPGDFCEEPKGPVGLQEFAGAVNLADGDAAVIGEEQRDVQDTTARGDA